MLVVVDFEFRQRAFELALAILDFGEYRLGDPPPLGDLADRLPQRLLPASDLVELFLDIGGNVLALLQRNLLLGFRQPFLELAMASCGVLSTRCWTTPSK